GCAPLSLHVALPISGGRLEDLRSDGQQFESILLFQVHATGLVRFRLLSPGKQRENAGQRAVAKVDRLGRTGDPLYLDRIEDFLPDRKSTRLNSSHVK